MSDGLTAIPTGDKDKTIAGCRDFLGRVLNLSAMAQAASRDAGPRMTAAQHDD